MGTAGFFRRASRALVGLTTMTLLAAMAVTPASADPVEPPATPTRLRTSGLPCGGEPIFVPSDYNYLLVDVVHVGGNYGLGARFTLWEVDRPEHRYASSESSYGMSYVRAGVPADFFADGRTYEWTARAERIDGQVSPESVSCRFTTDFTPPADAPLVTSTDYPENSGDPGTGGGSIPGRFTFSANGDEDVVGFHYWGAKSDKRVAADRPGGTASADIEPGGEGNSAIYVYSFDRAGHHSPTRTFPFYVRWTAPLVTSTPLRSPVGVPRVITFTSEPGFEPVVEYTYRFKDQEPVTIPAAADGTASIAFTPTTPYIELLVFGRTATGLKTGEVRESFSAPGGYPVVSSDVYLEYEISGGVGVPGVFTFTPAMPGVVEYTYQIDDEKPVKIPAAADGTASFTYTPTDTGWHALWVRSRTAAGIESPYSEDYYFGVAD